MRVLVWIPSRPTEVMKPIWRTVAWAQNLDVEQSPGEIVDFDPDHFQWPKRSHDVLIWGDVKSTSLSMARSVGIHLAKRTGALLIMVDADTAPYVNIPKVVGLLNSATAQGFGSVISPAVSESGTVGVVSPKKNEKGEYIAFDQLGEIPEGLFVIGAGTGGFIAVTTPCLAKWEPVGSFEWKGDATHKAKKVPMYYRWSETEGQSEDYAMLQHIRDVIGVKIGGDTRLWTSHTKTFGLPSYRGPGEGVGRQ